MLYSLKGLSLVSLALGVGYIVCVAASKEKGLLKSIGYIIGVLIIAASIAGATLRLCTTGCPFGSMKGISGVKTTSIAK